MREKLFIGGLGGLMPIVASFILLDADTFANYLQDWNNPDTKNMYYLLGYIGKATILFLVGMLWAYFHKTEESLLKIFQLGIVAPAIIGGFVQANNVKNLKDIVPDKKKDALLFFLVPSAYAQSPTQGLPDKVKQYTLPPQSEGSQFLKGLIGIPQKNIWFVISGARSTLEEAERRAQEILKKGFRADVYESFAKPEDYDVVIGAHLTESEADELASKAIEKGLRTYLAGKLEWGGMRIKPGPKK